MNQETIFGTLLQRDDSNQTNKVVKSARAFTWTKNISLDTYREQIKTWDKVGNKVPHNKKYPDINESLRNIKGL